MSDHPSNSDDSEDDEEKDTSKDATVKPPTATSNGTTFTATPVVGFSADEIQDRLDDGKIAESLLMTSTRLENILSRAIADRYDITTVQFDDLFGNQSLGRYRYMTETLGLFNPHQDALKVVVEYRNKLAHDYGYLDTLQTDTDEREEVEALIEDAIAFIEQVEL